MSNYPKGYYKGKTTGGKNTAMSSRNYKPETVEEVLSYPCLAVEDRGITQKTAEKFGVRTALDTKDGKTPIAYYFPYYMEGKIVGFKKRDLTKPKQQTSHFSVVGYQSIKCDMFGMHVANKTGGKKVWVTEGEWDCLVVWQTLKNKYPQANPSVVSISNGTASAVLNIGQKQNMKFMKKFQENILCFDNDRASPKEKAEGVRKGVEATSEVYGLLPEVKVVPLPEDKDPCETYLEQGEEQFYWTLMKPVQYTPEGFVKYDEIREKAIELPTLGKPWPWPSLTKVTLGRRIGEGYYFGAGVKMGKSVVVDTLTEHITTNDKNKLGEHQKVALFKFEEQPDETVKKVAGKFYRKNFSDPEKVIFIDKDGKEVDIWGEPIPEHTKHTYFTHEELIKAVDSTGDKLVMYNNYGRCNWDELKGAIRHAVLVEHIEDIFIDPITRLTAGMSAAEANTELERFADEISKMSQDLGFTYYCFCHLKAPDKGPSHEFGGKIMSSQFRGSRAMMQACHYMFGLEGNKDPEQPEKVRNTRHFLVLDDRKFGRTAKIPLFYDTDTGVFDEPPEGFLEDEYCQRLSEWSINEPSVNKVNEKVDDEVEHKEDLKSSFVQEPDTDFEDLDFESDELPFD